MKKRIGRFGRLKPGAAEEYIRLHHDSPKGLLKTLHKAGVRNFSIYIHGDELFSYLETEKDWEEVMAYLDQDPPTREWSKLMSTLLDEPLPWPLLDEVFHID
jgi:L-rhamnose mutarotase